MASIGIFAGAAGVLWVCSEPMGPAVKKLLLLFGDGGLLCEKCFELINDELV